ncbi:MAG: protein kinase, partial [Pirellulaceae bacterium]|nr:protein kinase [Pirellulaceae bacterium]
MATPEENPENSDDEIAQVADAYFRDRKCGTATSIAEYLERYPHLGPELTEALEAIDLLLATPNDRVPESFGDFHIDRELARGGMGTVYLATQVSLRRKVALKVLKTFLRDQAAVSELFQRETQTIAALQHENIVPIFSAGEVNGLPYFTMPWIDGQSAAQLISQHKSMALSRRDQLARAHQIARWGAEVADALQCAHQHGIVHRDIKPSNLLVDRNQRIWLTDFGLACREGDGSAHLTSPDQGAGPYQGTPNYMSPEQASAIVAPVDHRTDIYSLGVTLIEWLTGQSVVGGSSPVESLSRLQHNSVEDPRRILRGYSRDWIAVLEKCVAREPKDRYQSAAELAADLRAIADHRPVGVRSQHALTRHVRELFSHKNSVPSAGVACVALLAAILIGGVVWRAVANANMQRVMFTSNSGEWLKVTARDALGKPVAECTTVDGEVWLPRNVARVDVVASQRLGYQRTISQGALTADALASGDGLQVIRLAAPQAQRWLCDDILWYECCEVVRHGESASYCLTIRSDGIVMLDMRTGHILWSFHDEQTHWGDSVRGSPSTFQPDRCVIIHDTNGNDCQEVVFAHPNKPEILCLDSDSGEQLWRTNLIESAGMQLPNAGSLCPIVLQYSDDAVDQAARLSVVIAPHARLLSTTNRGLFNVDPATGSVRWWLASLQSSANPARVTAFPRPLHLQWGSAVQRPIDFGEHLQFSDFDGYGRTKPYPGSLNPYDLEPRLGTDRPLLLRSKSATAWHWIDGSDWHLVDAQSGQLIATWQLPDDCVCSPKLLRSADGRILVLTAHIARQDVTDFIAWDIETNQVAWKQTLDCDLNRLAQSYLSRSSDFPIVVDLDADGSDEWIAPSHVPGAIWSHTMTPPFGMVTAHRGDNGQALWSEPFRLPNMDGMIQRGLAIADQDGDGWKELVLGSRFQGVGLQSRVGCFVDVISGKTGKRIWQSQVQTESSQPNEARTELVDLTISEDQRFIAVVTHSGTRPSGFESARPYSTTFLHSEYGRQAAYGLGIRASYLDHDTWLE